MDKILIVEDEKKIAGLIDAYCQKEGFHTAVAHDGQEGIKQFEMYEPDLVILDRMLPGKSGEEVFRWIKKRRAVPVIMVTARDTEPEILDGYSMGTDDYVTKPFSPSVLMARIRAVLKRSGSTKFRDKIYFKGLEVHPETGKAVVRGEEKDLSPREFEILYLLCRNPGRVFSRDMIADAAFGDAYDSFDRTIDSHIKNLRKKIEEDSRSPVYILTVYGMGYKFGGEPV